MTPARMESTVLWWRAGLELAFDMCSKLGKVHSQFGTPRATDTYVRAGRAAHGATGNPFRVASARAAETGKFSHVLLYVLMRILPRPELGRTEPR